MQICDGVFSSQALFGREQIEIVNFSALFLLN